MNAATGMRRKGSRVRGMERVSQMRFGCYSEQKKTTTNATAGPSTPPFADARTASLRMTHPFIFRDREDGGCS